MFRIGNRTTPGSIGVVGNSTHIRFNRSSHGRNDFTGAFVFLAS